MNQSKKEYYYFQPGEILFHLSHSADERLDAQSFPKEEEEKPHLPQRDDESSDQLLNSQEENDQRDPSFDEIIEIGLIQTCNEMGKELKLTASRLKDREIHFPGTNNLPSLSKSDAEPLWNDNYKPPQPKRRGAFSIIPVRIDTAGQSSDPKNPDGFVDFDKLSELIQKYNKNIPEFNRKLNSSPASRPAIKVKVVTPNWLSSPCDEWTGGGGPGSRPVPYQDKDGQVPYMFDFTDNTKNLFSEYEKRGEGVKVAILDTAPCLHDLAEAYERYHKVDPGNQPPEFHPLIERLLGPGGRLHVHPASLDDLVRLRAVYLKDHDYKMTDHGLFVAGIINTIAPAAELHLYEVLNPQGVGDLLSIAGGLLKVAEEQYNLLINGNPVQPTVINCSLMLNIPLHGNAEDPNSDKGLQVEDKDKNKKIKNKKIFGHHLKDLSQGILDIIKSDPEWVESSGKIIMWICDLLFWCNSRVIAAAGNDGRSGNEGQSGNEERPEARYPAAFESVLGVGALPRDTAKLKRSRRRASSFSNLSDAPSNIGIATLGGEPGEHMGVLGIYLGEFPPGQSGSSVNPPGQMKRKDWAWWAGTSFATPIVTGAIAAVMSGPEHPKTPEDAISLMYEKGVIENNRTEYEEDLLDVEQK